MQFLAALWAQVPEFFMQYGVLGLAAVSFAEASFFPVIPDVLLVPMALMNPELALFYGAVTTLASTAGALFGYWLGWRAGRPLLTRWVSPAHTRRVEGLFQQYGGWAVAVAGLTPIPFKVFTIAAGVFGTRKRVLVLASLFGRGLRFMFEALVVLWMGEQALAWLNRYAEELTLGLALLFSLAYFLYLWWRRTAGGV